MTGIPYTPKEDREIVSRWGKDIARKIADDLGRNVRSVYNRAFRLGVVRKQDKKEIEERKRRIRLWISRGWNDSEIATKVGMDRREVARMRGVMGVPATGRGERYRKRVAATTKRQCKEAGVSSLAEIKSKEVSKLADALGWPEHLSLRSLQIVEALYSRGPMTRKELAAAIGIRWKGSRKTFGTNRVKGGSYLAALVYDGLVVRLENAITHAGKGNHEDVYMIALEVEPCQDKRSRSQLRRLKTQSDARQT